MAKISDKYPRVEQLPGFPPQTTVIGEAKPGQKVHNTGRESAHLFWRLSKIPLIGILAVEGLGATHLPVLDAPAKGVTWFDVNVGHTVDPVKKPNSHIGNANVQTPTHEEAVAILANARPNAAEVSPDGPMVEEFGPNQSETGPFTTKNGNFQLLHSGQLAQELNTAVAVERVGDKIVTTEGP